MSFATRGNVISRAVAALLIAMLLVPAMAFAQERQITEVRIVGNEHISTEAVLAVIALSPGTPYTDPAVQAARQAIEKMGYFERVTVSTENTDGGVRVIFNVIENPVVKDIVITGNTVVTTEKLRSLMRTAVGGVLNLNALGQQDIPAIERYYDEQGYIAYVTENYGIDKEGVLTIPILEVRIEDVRVVGNTKTKTFVILREMQQKPGDVFNRRLLFDDLRRIYDLEIFDRESAEGYRLEAGSDLGKVIVTIPVKERKTGEVSVGLGYSSREKLVGQAKLSERNFRGRAETVNLLWEQSTGNDGNGGSSYELGFFEPWVDAKHTSLGVNVYNKLIYRFSSDFIGTTSDTTSGGYAERRKGGSATLSRPLDRLSRGFLTARSESVSSNIGTSSVLASSGNVTSGTLRYTRSSRDSEVEPLTGSYSSYSAEIGNADFDHFDRFITVPVINPAPGQPVTQQIPAFVREASIFTKYSADYRRYFSKGGPRKELNEKRRVLAVRLMGGTLAGNVPFFEQYFVGGAESLRGYREDRFWGNNMFLASVESRIPLGQSLTGVVFLDAGDAWGASSEFRDPAASGLGNLLTTLPQHSNFSPRFGYGLGIRVGTPIGPLRLDYGFGSDTPRSRAHFSIGHVF